MSAWFVSEPFFCVSVCVCVCVLFRVVFFFNGKGVNHTDIDTGHACFNFVARAGWSSRDLQPLSTTDSDPW